MNQYLDTSVILKWFLKEEELAEEADQILQDITELSRDFIVSEWVVPELVRGLVKNGWSEKDINEAYESFWDLIRLGGIRMIAVSDVILDLKDLEIKYNLYGSDAVHLATALNTHCEILWTEDDHLLKKKIANDMKRNRLKVLSIEKYR